jgi:phenylpropionate dioxygenase-like ring-hydroxylating dioxygenase large terminal subunit
MPAPSRYVSAEYFQAEMEALSSACWQFVCTTDDLANNGDWVRRRVFGTDLFVQNFDGDLRGYHNVCQHRGFPLRRERSGNGVVQCGFHGWAYDREGVPVGVARNQELFCLSREEKAGLAIPRVRVAAVGRFVFVALSDEVPPIEDYLGRYHAMFQAVSRLMRARRRQGSGHSRANWKLCFEVTLDDYHVSFVHPGTGWLLHQSGCFYGREGHHSHLLRRRTPDWEFPTFWDDVFRGEYEVRGYKIHQTFPNLLLTVQPRMVLITLYAPQGPALTEVEDIVFDIEGDPEDEPWWDELWTGHRQVSEEDRQTVESQQETIAQFDRRPLFGALEERVGWFQQSYEELIGAEAHRRMARGD